MKRALPCSARSSSTANAFATIADLSLLENNAGRLDQGVYWATRGIPLAPNLASSYYHLAIPLLVLDDATAARVLDAAEAKFPVTDPGGGVRLQMMQSIIELRRGRPDAALARLRATVVAEPNDTEAQQMITEVAVFGGAGDAAAHLDKALQGGRHGPIVVDAVHSSHDARVSLSPVRRARTRGAAH